MKIPLVNLKVQYQSIKQEIDNTIQRILDNTCFIMGKPVKEFEENLANFCDCQHAIGVASGSAALFLALKAYGIKEGDEVITAPNSFIATAEAVVQCGATPVFVDVEERTMLMDPRKISEKITARTKAIIPVYLYGQTCDMDPIIEIAQRHNLHIIEDAAQAIGAEYKGKRLPIHETAIFSFFPAKNLGCYGDGGAVVTDNPSIAATVSKLRDHGRISKYESDIIGYGERLDALQAAILDVKLKSLEGWTEMRRQNARHYNELLGRSAGIRIHFEEKHSRHVYYMYVIRVVQRDGLMDFLKEKGIATGIHYPVPLHLQSSLAYLGYKDGDFPVAEKAAKEILSLPVYAELGEEQIVSVCEAIREYYDGR